ncbi:hypothetical protein COV23_00825 [Candidatus Wolfebacteria bacterium CG10_big_fil_rev_8_21_14_0_10_31_9]|uniref:Metal-dependent hydrolase n=1 Tax=Candidatus Wolfebacteria bacterium CG10_big_fil_rev_8_21_14_0_10_31_9 TaxID=1975070 RepID=A0A2H0RD18_9BACT|nr:MAG: hypothetical protein COV23_00825 [Candidatus Wolfebacteria bacterium CG10_big_fil_rev_8_21_14_0_10_31_9]
MTFAHPLIGLILGKELGYTTAFVVGSVFPDIDHIFVLLKNKHFKPKEMFEAMKYEKKYGEIYKTPYTHSILSWIIFSSFILLIDENIGLAFCIGYAIHLLLDAINTDDKQYFYTLKKTFKGFLPVFSWVEIIVGVVLVALYLI